MYNNFQNSGYRNVAQKQTAQISSLPIFDFEHITTDLFSNKAQEYAKICSNPINKKNKPDNKLNKGTQLRRFYDEVVLWTERSDTADKFRNNLPFIYMIKSKVAYAYGRELVDENFRNLMFGVIDGIKENNIKTLKNAKLFLEAFMGFYKELKGDN